MTEYTNLTREQLIERLRALESRMAVTPEQALSEAEQHEIAAHMLQLVASVDEAFWICDLDQERFLYLSPAVETLFGLPLADLYDEPPCFLSMVHPEDRDRVVTACMRQHADGKNLDLECRILRGPDDLRRVRLRRFPIRDATGRIYRMAGIARDVTVRRESEQEYGTLIKASMDGFWKVGPDGRLLDCNEAACAMLGYGREEMLALSVHDIDLLEDEAEAAAHVRLVITQGHDRFETRHQRKDGRIIDVEVSAYHTPGEEGGFLFAFSRDITEKMIVEVSLRESEARLRLALQAAHAGVWEWNVASGALLWSAEMYRLYGLEPTLDPLTFEDWASRVHPDDLVHNKAIFSDMFAGRLDEYRSEFRVRPGAGMERWVLALARLRRAADGSPAHLLGINLDITERKHVEEALMASEERYRAVVEDQTELICRLLADGTLTFVNPVFCRFFGKREEELIGTTWHPAAHPDDVAMIEAKLATLSPSNPVVIIENRVTSGQGQERWMQFVNRAFFDDAGGLSQIQAVARDITDRKLAEESLRKSEIRFRSYFELSLGGIAITSLEKGWMEVNQRLCAILGYSRDELVRLTWPEITHPDDIAGDVAQFERVLAGESEGYSLDKRFIHKNGQVIDASISVRCIRRSDGTPDYFVALVQDITERKFAEQALHAAE